MHAEEHNKLLRDILSLSYEDLTDADLEADDASPRGRSVALERRRLREKTELLHKYCKAFSDDSHSLLDAKLHPHISSPDLARMAMAGVVYFSVYNKPPWLCRGMKRVDFSWKLCGSELLFLK